MGNLPAEQVVGVLLELFGEAYEGATKPYTWFVNNGPDAGLFGSLAGLTAGQASTSATPGGSTIASHTEHLRWSLALANAYMRGEEPQVRWSESWSVRTVDPASWDRLQADLRREYATLREAIAARTDWSNPQFLTGTMALVPHAAYHLGAIRQMMSIVR